jgi:two-component system, cell cycle sensor histidine kinase PleC
MVRAFAASTFFVRQNLGRMFRQAAGAHRSSDDTPARQLIDVLIPALVVLFLLIVATGAIFQFNVSRQSTLIASEKALHMAGELLATHIRIKQEAGAFGTDLVTRLPVNMQAQGRRFFLLGENELVVAANESGAEAGMPMHRLFAERFSLVEEVHKQTVSQLRLANGDLASLAVFPLSSPYSALVALQPVDDELVTWYQDASILAALLMCCGAVTLSFTLAFCAQRARARSIGDQASFMQIQFETALNKGNCGLWQCNITNDAITFSQSMFRLLGLHDREGAVERGFVRSLLHGEDPSPLDLIDTLRRKGHTEFDHLFRMRHADQSWVWLRMRAVRVEPQCNRPAALVCIVMDVTEERNAEIEGHKADARLRDAIESISESFVLWDENGRLVMCNSKYRIFHDIPALEAQRGADYTHHMARARKPSAIVEMEIGHERSSGNRSYEAQFNDGRWLLVSERPTKHGGHVIVGTDITTRKKQEDQLLENERKLRMTISDLGASREALRKQANELAELAELYQEQKIEAISASRLKAEFLANMNHEIRTPLNHIIGFAEMMEQEVHGHIGSPRYSEYARDIRLSGEGLLTIISDIIDMARIESGRITLKRNPHMVGALLDDAALQVANDAQAKGIDLHVSPKLGDANSSRMILVDRTLMGQALAHLLRNSIRFSPAGGTISMRMSRIGEHINIFIADSGYALSATDISTMSCPFGHVDGMLDDGCKGSGLGLAIARALVELHGGSLRIRARPNHGSITMVHLPIAADAVQLDLPMLDMGRTSIH